MVSEKWEANLSFLTDLFEGNTGNLGNDLFGSPTAILETLGAVAAPFAAFAAPEILGAAAIPDVGSAAAGLGAADLAAGGASLSAADAAALPAGLGDFSYLDAIPGLGGAPGAAGAGASSALGFAEDVAPAAQPSVFSGAGSAFDMGGGGDLAPPTAAPAAPLPAWAQAPTTGVPLAPDTALTTPEFSTPSPANPMTGGQFGSPTPVPGAPAGATSGWDTALKLAGPVIGAGGLGYSIYEGQQQQKQQAALTAQEATNAAELAAAGQVAQTAATPLINQGTTLMNYLTTGTLPQVFQDQIKGQIAAARAQIIQGYASRGMSSDPNQNSSLNQDLNNLNLQQEALQAQLETMLSTAGNQMVQTANQLLASGLQATQLSAELPIQVSQLNIQLNTQMSNAISNFAAAINGGRNLNAGNVGKGGGITLTP